MPIIIVERIAKACSKIAKADIEKIGRKKLSH